MKQHPLSATSKQTPTGPAKKTTVFASAFCLLLGLTMPASASVLVLKYEFNNAAQDTSGHGNDGTVNGALIAGGVASINNPQGPVAVNQFVSLPNSAELASLASSSFAIAVRYKTTDTGLLNGRLFGNNTIHIDYNDGGKDVSYAGLQGLYVAGRDGALSVNGRVTDGDYHWQLLVVDRSNNQAYHYVDNILTGSTGIDPTPFSFSNLVLGGNSSAMIYGAKDTVVDELRIYKGAGRAASFTTPDAGQSLGMLGLSASCMLLFRRTKATAENKVKG